MPSRRVLLLGGAGAAAAVLVGGGEAVEHDVLPGRVGAYRALGLDGPDGVVPSAAPVPVELGTTSGVDWALCAPATAPKRGMRVVVALSGRGNSRDYLMHSLGLPRFLAASGLPLAILAVAGGTSYYHPRRDGTDVGGVVLDALLPNLGDRGFSVDAPAFLGWSMGGYGALLLASQRRERGRGVSAVAATSPAIFTSYGGSAPGAFDSAADFARNDLNGARRPFLAGVPTRVWCGTGDPFRYTSEDLARRIGAPYVSARGAHNGAYWRRVLAAELRFLGGHLLA
jgi:pimeloyl-ACP methyl ester carboxylesterase